MMGAVVVVLAAAYALVAIALAVLDVVEPWESLVLVIALAAVLIIGAKTE